MDVDLSTPPMPIANAEELGIAPQEIVVLDADGNILLRRPKSPLELAIDIYGPVQQTADWRVHPACANPPAHSGVCTYQFPDGRLWCFKCQEPWTP